MSRLTTPREWLAYALIALILISSLGALYLSYDASRQLENIREELQRQGQQIEGSRQDIDRISGGVSDLRARLGKVEEDLRQAARASDLRSLAEELGKIRAELSLLRQADAELLARAERLSKEMERLAESMLFPAKVVDGAGETVIIRSRPQRIVSLAPSVTEILYYLNLTQNIVGTDSFSDFPKSVKERRERGEIADIGGFVTPVVEKIVAVKPDVVIGVATASTHVRMKSLLAQYGIPVIVLPASTLSDIERSIVIVGEATGRIVEAYETVYRYRLAINYAVALAAKGKPMNITAVVWPQPIFVVGSGSWQHDVISLIGKNVFEDLRGWPSVSPEALLAKKPSIILITTSHGRTSREDFINSLIASLGNAAYQIPAVRDGNVYAISGQYEDAFVRPSPRTVLAIYAVLIFTQPQVFGLDPAAVPKDIKIENIDVLTVLKDQAPPEILSFLARGIER